MPDDPACPAPRRLDAIYEGLALSVATAPLSFPKKRGRVPAGCEATAKRAARIVDEAILRVLIPEALRRDTETAAAAIEDARKSCGDLQGASAETLDRVKHAKDALAATHVEDITRALRAFAATPFEAAGAPPQPTPSAAEQACLKALGAVRSIAPDRLDALANQGLAQASLDALVASLRASTAETMTLVVRFGSGAATGGDLGALIGELVQGAGMPADAPLLKDAIGALSRAIAEAGGGPTIDPNALLSFLTKRYDVGDDGKPSLRSLLGLGPTPWVFELNGGLPNVDPSQAKVVADITFGYATKSFGVVGRGWLDTYTIDDTQTHNDYTHTGGSLEGWWLTGAATNKLRLELRLTGAFDYFDTTTYPFVDALKNFYDYDSRMGRGTAFVGVRYGAPLDQVSLQLLAGGGFQYEDPDTTALQGNGKSLSLKSDRNTTAQASARLLLRVHLVPQIVGVRLPRGFDLFQHHARRALGLERRRRAHDDLGLPAAAATRGAHPRVLDADVASFAGFVPAVFGGFDYIGITGDTTKTSAAIPLLGVGFVRTTW